MIDNWEGADQYYGGAPPTSDTKSASVHENKNQALIVEELADKHAIFIVKKTDPYEVLREVGRGIEKKHVAKQRARTWMDNNPDGLANHP